jgi:hypothetical protein
MKDLKKLKVVKRDSIEYYLHAVKLKGESVGFVPVLKLEDMDDMLNSLNPDKVFELAYRQLFSDSANSVRSSLAGEVSDDKKFTFVMKDKDLAVKALQLVSEKKFDSVEKAALSLYPQAEDEYDEEFVHWAQVIK